MGVARSRDRRRSLFSPGRAWNRPLAWKDFYFTTGGKLWLFQCRPFVGNDALKNVTALAALEGPVGKGTEMVSFEEKLR